MYASPKKPIRTDSFVKYNILQAIGRKRFDQLKYTKRKGYDENHVFEAGKSCLLAISRLLPASKNDTLSLLFFALRARCLIA